MIPIIVVIIFVIAVILIAVISGRSAKTALELEPGERVISDEAPVRVEQQTPVQTGVYGRCRVLVTDRRVIIAQAPLFGKKYTVPRCSVTLSDTGSQTDLGSTVKKGFLVMTVPRSSVKVETSDKVKSPSRKNRDSAGADGTPRNGGGDEFFAVTIPVPDSGLTSGQFIKFSTKYPEGFS